MAAGAEGQARIHDEGEGEEGVDHRHRPAGGQGLQRPELRELVEDEDGQDAIAIRSMMNVTLTYDHRLVDGALAGRFLRDLRERLESWDEHSE